MGLLDQLAGALGQAGAQGSVGNQAQGGLLDVVMGMVQGHAGGLQGLVEQLAAGGLGEQVKSWISGGQNLPVSPGQITAALGNDRVKQIADQLGLSHGDAASGLAGLLPQVIDHLTPNGEVQHGLVEDGLSLLKGKLFG